MKAPLFTLLAVLFVFTAGAQTWIEQSANLKRSLDSTSRKVEVCKAVVSDYDSKAKLPNDYIRKDITDKVKVDASAAGCKVIVDYTVNCKGEVGNYVYHVSVKNPACESFIKDVANYLNGLPAVAPVTQSGQPVDFAMTEMKITWNSEQGFYVGY